MGENVAEYNGFNIDLERLGLVFQSVNTLANEGRGIFRGGLRQYLPQWNLPKELEYSPQKKQVVNPELAGRFLATRVFIDRISLSNIVHAQTLKLWYDSKDNWMFNPKEVAQRDSKEIGEILRTKLYYNVPLVNPKKEKSEKIESLELVSGNAEKSSGKTAGEGYRNNALIIAEKFDNDPRNLIRYKTVAQARQTLQGLDGFGSGIANLYLLECGDRDIANPLDRENLYPKIDRHKARIPLNTGVVTLKNGTKESGRIHANTLVAPLEEAYLQTARKLGIDLTEIDAGLWIIGSQICARNNIHACQNSCPLYREGLCQVNTPLGHEDGYFHVTNSKGERVDGRKNAGQLELMASDTHTSKPKSG